MGKLTGFVVLILLAMGGNWLAERFVLKDPTDPNDTGFIPHVPGPGWDDLARGAVIGGTVMIGGYVVRRIFGKRHQVMV